MRCESSEDETMSRPESTKKRKLNNEWEYVQNAEQNDENKRKRKQANEHTESRSSYESTCSTKISRLSAEWVREKLSPTTCSYSKQSFHAQLSSRSPPSRYARSRLSTSRTSSSSRSTMDSSSRHESRISNGRSRFGRSRHGSRHGSPRNGSSFPSSRSNARRRS